MANKKKFQIKDVETDQVIGVIFVLNGQVKVRIDSEDELYGDIESEWEDAAKKAVGYVNGGDGEVNATKTVKLNPKSDLRQIAEYISTDVPCDNCYIDL